MTCAQAARVFRDWANDSPYQDDCNRLRGQAEILEMFGDQPVPEKMHEVWDFSRTRYR